MDNLPINADAFYQIDHRLIAVVMVGLLLLACETGYRLGLAKTGFPDSLRTLMTRIFPWRNHSFALIFVWKFA